MRGVRCPVLVWHLLVLWRMLGDPPWTHQRHRKTENERTTEESWQCFLGDFPPKKTQIRQRPPTVQCRIASDLAVCCGKFASGTYRHILAAHCDTKCSPWQSSADAGVVEAPSSSSLAAQQHLAVMSAVRHACNSLSPTIIWVIRSLSHPILTKDSDQWLGQKFWELRAFNKFEMNMNLNHEGRIERVISFSELMQDCRQFHAILLLVAFVCICSVDERARHGLENFVSQRTCSWTPCNWNRLASSSTTKKHNKPHTYTAPRKGYHRQEGSSARYSEITISRPHHPVRIALSLPGLQD